jgi:non-ribosomal peptide synthetase component F/acyl carrier protein
MSTNKVAVIFDRAMHEARRYWCDRVDDLSFSQHLPLDHPRSRDGERQMSHFEYTLDSDVHALLERATAGQPFLRYTSLVLGIMICCSKYSGQASTTILSPVELEPGVSNLLAIGGAIDRAASFKSALISTRELLADAYQNRQYPFSRLLLDLPVDRRPKQLHIIIALEEFNGQLPEECSDIGVLFQTRGDATVAVVRFDSRAYEEATLRQFLRSCDAILRTGLTDMSLPIRGLAVDVPAPVGELAHPSTHVTGGESAGRHVVHTSVDTRIQWQAEQRPDAAAVLDGERIFTYRMLFERVASLAETIAAIRVDRRKPIGVLMEPSPESISAMLAVMRAGAPFAPIRPLSTTHSIEQVLNVLGCECIVCKDEHLGHLREYVTGLKLAITVSVGTNNECKYVPVELAPSNSPMPAPTEGWTNADGFARPACVVPNGNAASAIAHGELLGLFDWLNELCGVTAADRALLTPSLGLCEQLYDTLGMLSAGASVEILDSSSASQAAGLARRLMSPAITVWDVPTPLMQNILDHVAALRGNSEGARGARVILLPGEKQCSMLQERLRGLFPTARVAGVYAVPGFHLWTTMFAAEGERQAVAQPIPGFEHRVLNTLGESSPLLAKGDLHVQRLGEGVDRSATPWPRVQRLDATRMRWLRGHNHSFIKSDCCVELTELEAALCRHERIRGAEVLAVRMDGDAEQQVIAFIIADETTILSAESARDFLVLGGGLDLIPDRFVVLPEFPLLADGSIDTDALLRRFVSSGSRPGVLRGGTNSAIYTQLKRMWVDVLEVAAIDDDDSFFSSGGNSLKATLLIARIRDEFQVELSVQSFFRKPTARAVADLIAAASTNAIAMDKEPDVQVVPRQDYRVLLTSTGN